MVTEFEFQATSGPCSACRDHVKGHSVRSGDDVEEVQWRVTWFPPDVEQRSKTGALDKVLQLAREHADWFPIIESREVGAWHTEQP